MIEKAGLGQTGPATWTSAHLDSEMQAIEAKGTAQTPIDAVQLDALDHIKSIKEQLNSQHASFMSGEGGVPQFQQIQQICDLNVSLCHYNNQYENASALAGAWPSITAP